MPARCILPCILPCIISADRANLHLHPPHCTPCTLCVSAFPPLLRDERGRLRPQAVCGCWLHPMSVCTRPPLTSVFMHYHIPCLFHVCMRKRHQMRCLRHIHHAISDHAIRWAQCPARRAWPHSRPACAMHRTQGLLLANDLSCPVLQRGACHRLLG